MQTCILYCLPILEPFSSSWLFLNKVVKYDGPTVFPIGEMADQSVRLVASELHVRSFLEAVDPGHISSAEICKIELPAHELNSKVFLGNAATITITWRKQSANCTIR